jgi:alpha-tubulin suppressor-like RCC1 family protein
MRLRIAVLIALLLAVFPASAASSIELEPQDLKIATEDPAGLPLGPYMAIHLVTPVAANQVGQSLEAMNRRIAAASHTGASSGFYRVPETMEGGAFFERYAALLGVAADDFLIDGIVVEGVVTTLQLSQFGWNVLKAEMTTDSHAATRVSGNYTHVPLDARTEPVPPDGDWWPRTGTVHAENINVPDIGERREINQLFVWDSAESLERLADWAYEHDTKLFAKDQGFVVPVPKRRWPACIGPGADDFWADRDALRDEFLDTNLPEDANYYLDTMAGDECDRQDFTVGILHPGNLSHDVNYWTRIVSAPGDVESSPVNLAAEILPRDCNLRLLSQWCANTKSFDDLGRPELAKLLVGRAVFSAPGCRAWTAGEDSADCGDEPSGGVHMWGVNAYGQFGDGSSTWDSAPTPQMTLPAGATAAAVGRAHTCAIVGGGLMCAGLNGAFGVGGGSWEYVHDWTPVPELSEGVTAVVAGLWHTCVMQGEVAKCAGDNYYGQVGNPGVGGDAETFVQVQGLTSDVTHISARANMTCAVHAGAAKCWGSGIDGDSFETTSPNVISGLTNGVTRVAAGDWGGCAVQFGAAKCWGDDFGYGRLGNGEQYVVRESAQQVTGLGSGVTDIAMSMSHACAIRSGGMLCWGSNNNGQMGSGSTAPSYEPQLEAQVVPGLTSRVTNIALGHDTSAAIKDGILLVFGSNWYGELGIGYEGGNQPNPASIDTTYGRALWVDLQSDHSVAVLTPAS